MTNVGWANWTNTATASSSYVPLAWYGASAAGVYPNYAPSAAAYQPTGGYIDYDDLAQERMTDVAARIKRRLDHGDG